MPAFSTTKSEKEIWRIVAFLRHLPQLTDVERERLRDRRED
jgi:mono/diheme cytochrome c family protein